MAQSSPFSLSLFLARSRLIDSVTPGKHSGIGCFRRHFSFSFGTAALSFGRRDPPSSSIKTFIGLMEILTYLISVDCLVTPVRVTEWLDVQKTAHKNHPLHNTLVEWAGSLYHTWLRMHIFIR